ncbi:hypothetical protein C8Q76DRAFT_632248, partial [Earliella scabrosa]
SMLQRPCAVCSTPSTLTCGNCGTVWYCSYDHAKEDWQYHGRACTIHQIGLAEIHRRTSTLAERQTTMSVYETDNPYYIQMADVEYIHARRPPPGQHVRPLIHRWIDSRAAANVVITKGLTGDDLRYPLDVWYDRTAYQAGGSRNGAVDVLCQSTVHQDWKEWSGNAVVLKFAGCRKQAYRDVNELDLYILAMYFTSLR